MKIASAAYPLDFLPDWDAYAKKQRKWVSEAAGHGAELLVFPEYGAMELASLAGTEAASEIESSMRATSDRLQATVDLHCSLAHEFGVWILSGSGPVYDPGPRPVNRAGFYAPDGTVAFQDKQIMTRFEREEMDVVPGSGLKLFECGPFRAGVTICYDSEFPLLGRKLAEAGSDLLLCPSCTETEAGYTRVRVGAMARALENQCIAVHAPLVGDCPWLPAVEAGRGAAAIYGPPDKGFPSDGILAQGKMNAPGWVYAEATPAAVEAVREDGAVLNFRHWDEQADRIKNATFARKD